MPDAVLKLHVTPRASGNQITGWRGDLLHIKVTAPPVDNAANEAVVKFVADAIGVRKNQVELISGAKSRQKTLRIAGLSQCDVLCRLPSPAQHS